MPKYLLHNNVHIWHLNISQTKNHYDYFYNLLSKDEKLKVERFKFKKDKITSVMARGTLRVLFSKYLDCPTNDIIFEYGEYGKPELANHKTIQFNVSHARDIIVIALCNDYDIGIDVEYIKKDFDVLDIADNYFSKQEIKALHKIPANQQTEAFFRGWTRKEAFIKAKSQGLSFPLDSFSISINTDDNAELYETAWDKNEKKLWNIVPFKIHKDYKAAFAVKGNFNTIKYFNLSADNVLN